MGEEKSAAVMLAEMERERDELNSAINYLRRRMELPTIEGPTSAAAVNGKPSSSAARGAEVSQDGRGVEITRDMFFGMTLPDAIRSYLSMMKRPTKASAIIKALVDGGFQTTSGNFDGLVRSAISQRLRGEVVNLPNGWALASWYPGRTFEKKTKKKTRTRKRKARPSAGPDAPS